MASEAAEAGEELMTTETSMVSWAAGPGEGTPVTSMTVAGPLGAN